MTPSPARNLRALPQPLPDAELIELVMSGRPDAAARLYDRFARDIHRMVHRLLAVDTEHDDIVQEIFIKAWQLIAKGKVRNPEGLSAWMRSVATHTVYKEIRRRYVRRRFFRFQEPPPDAKAPLASEDERELLRIAYRIAGELAPSEQLAFALRHFDQRRLVEVAEMSGCSLATAKRRIARAEQQFLTMAAEYQRLPGAARPDQRRKGNRISRFDKLHILVYRHRDEVPKSTIASGRAAFIDAVGQTHRRPSMFHAWSLAAAVLVVVVGASGYWFARSRQTAVATVSSPQSASSSVRLELPASGPASLELTEGVTAELSAGTLAYRAEPVAGEHRVTLERGRLRLSIDPERHMHWTVVAGGYEVRVGGNHLQRGAPG